MKKKKAEKPASLKKAAAVKEKISEPVANKKADKKVIDNHKEAAAHHIEAAKHHMEAAKHYEAGNYEKAAHNTVLASGHHAIAGQFLTDDAKHHAQSQKETNYRD